MNFSKIMKKTSVTATAMAMLISAAAFPVSAQVQTNAEAETLESSYQSTVELLADNDNDSEATDITGLTVAPGSDVTQLRFAWYNTADLTPQVQIWETDNPENRIEASGSNSAASSGKRANKAEVTGLKASTDYTYRVGNDGAWTEEYEISTGNPDSFSFFFAGDPQIGAGTTATDIEGWQDTIQKATTQLGGADFMISGGDQVDTTVSLTGTTIENEYTGYLSPSELTGLPVAQTPGNHDLGSYYNYHFNMPNQSDIGGSLLNSQTDYWFRYGNALFMVINSNTTSISTHRTFMESAISENEDATWRFVVFHHSIYSIATHSTDSSIVNMRNSWPSVFEELKIDVALMGHDHSYARTYQMVDNVPQTEQTTLEDGTVVDPDGILYLTANSASGSKHYSVKAEYEYSAHQSQLGVPSITKIEMTDNTFSMKTYRMDDMSMTDSYDIVKTNLYDRGDLEELLGKAAEITDTSIYYESGITAFEEALKNAQEIFENPYATQTEIDSAASELRTAMTGLKMKAGMEELEELIKLCDTLKESDYTWETWFDLLVELTNAKEVAGSEPTQAQADNALALLQDAYDNLERIALDYSNLLTVLELAQEAIDNGDVEKAIPSKQKEFNEAFSRARALLEDETADQEDINNMAWELLNILNEVKSFQTGDKTQLELLYRVCAALNLNNFEDGQEKDDFIQALADVVTALEDEDALAEDLENAYNVLQAASRALIRRDKSQLGEAITYAQTIEAKLDSYVEAGQAEFLAALDTAKQVYDKEDASQAEIDDARKELIQAMDALRLKANKETLNALAEQARELELSKYTQESQDKLLFVLEQAEAVLSNEALSEDDQAIVDSMALLLQNTLNDLELKQTSAGGATSEDEGNSSSGEESSGSGEASDISSASNSNTGDNMAALLLLFPISMISAGCAIMLKRKTN